MDHITCKKCGSQMSAMSERCPLCGWPAGMDYDSKATELAKQRLLELQASQTATKDNKQIEPVPHLKKEQILALYFSLLSIIFSMSVIRGVDVLICLAFGILGIVLSVQELELSKKQSKNKQIKIDISEIPFMSLIVSVLSIIKVLISFLLLIRL